MNENEKMEITVNENTAPTTTIVDEEKNFIADLTNTHASYCSLSVKTKQDKARLYNATNGNAKRIADMINTQISVKDVFVESVQCTNTTTGEVKTCPRIVLIDSNLNGYQCVSVGVYSAIAKIFNIYGTPDQWEEPIKVMIKQISKGDRKMLTLEIVG